MTAEEIDTALNELETRLDRLRSLYEQYFLGIEKIEPSVARKDVDRRFWILRRTQIRNTARRFRLQVLIQRYNTFQQYWVRICREIENGTYSRHLLRAQKKLGSEPKTWAAKKRLGYFRRRGEGDNGHASEPPPAGEELGRMLDGGADLDAEAANAAAEALVSAAARSRDAARPEAAISPGNSGASPVQLSAPGPRPGRPRSNNLETLDLDLDDGLGPSPARPIPPSPPAARPPAPAPAPAPARPPAPSSRLQAPGSRLQPDPPPAPAPAAARPPAPAPPPAPARLPLPKPAQPRPTQASPEGTGLTDTRLKQIHAELSAAKRQAKQMDAVSLDALSRSLRESEQRIRAQHPGRSIDFHVVVKDGKPIVKPIVRK